MARKPLARPSVAPSVAELAELVAHTRAEYRRSLAHVRALQLAAEQARLEADLAFSLLLFDEMEHTPHAHADH